MTVTFCNSGHVKLKAGADVSTALTDDNYTTLINQAESFINNIVSIPGLNLVTDFASQNADVKNIIQDCASSHAALAAISYDLDNYPTTAQAQTMLDFNLNRITDCIAILKDKSKTDFLRGFNA